MRSDRQLKLISDCKAYLTDRGYQVCDTGGKDIPELFCFYPGEGRTEARKPFWLKFYDYSVRKENIPVYNMIFMMIQSGIEVFEPFSVPELERHIECIERNPTYKW